MLSLSWLFCPSTMSTGIEGEPKELIQPKHSRERTVRVLFMQGGEITMRLDRIKLVTLCSFDKIGAGFERMFGTRGAFQDQGYPKLPEGVARPPKTCQPSFNETPHSPARSVLFGLGKSRKTNSLPGKLPLGSGGGCSAQAHGFHSFLPV